MRRIAVRIGAVVAALATAIAGLVGLTSQVSAADPVGYTILQGEGCILAQVDLVTGAITEIGTGHNESCVADLEFSPDGSTLYGVRFVSSPSVSAHLVTFNLTTGLTTDLGALGSDQIIPNGGGNLTFGADGKPYTFLAHPVIPTSVASASCASDTLCIEQINLANLSSLTLINSVPQSNAQYLGLATSCAGVTMSVRDTTLLISSASTPGATAAVQTLTTVNLTSTGPGTTDVGPVTPQRVAGIDFDSAGNLYATGYDTTNNATALYKINTGTGATTFVADMTNGGPTVNFGAGALAIYHPCVAPTTTTTTTVPPVVILPAFTG
jgi:hypothetical protein